MALEIKVLDYGDVDAVAATGALVAAVSSGDITPSEAAELSKLIEGFVKSLEV